jgi:uncharacterized membrane protein YkoI
MALALVSVLSVSALIPSVLAAAPNQDDGKATTVQDTVKGGSHGKRGERSSVAEPENAIGKDAAKEKALTDAGVTAEQEGKVRSRVSQTDDGTVIYKVRFTCDGQCWHYQIDAVTGTILDKSVEAAAEHTDRQDEQGKRGRHGGHGECPDAAAETESNAA